MATSATIGVERQIELRELKADKVRHLSELHLAWDEIKQLKREVVYWKQRGKVT